MKKKLCFSLLLLVPVIGLFAQVSEGKSQAYLVKIEDSKDSMYVVAKDFIEDINTSEIVSIDIYKTVAEISRFGYDVNELIVVEVKRDYYAQLQKNAKVRIKPRR